ncbi:hypothetical protein HNR60_003542 [Rhodopseudomonas rhenobacensis]|uniref:Uncharacterized protein n=1 Tax=Rhodopseudomonas rhenobacensis TaxID=87461 RepID=A0A7W7Z6A5_9BRAD|nr:hypothetical protein [Rhodopseudomonas rhenobacensis]MBB5048772.1 hypothetical protein [Rhodopseudomonas rhenobacensis]
MTQITRLYDTSRQVPAIETELKNGSFKFAVVTSAQPSQPGTSLDDAILAALGRAGISRGEGRSYLDAIKKGGAVVSVVAEFGFGAKAAAILDRYSPNQSSIPASAAGSVEIDPATPFSNILHAPVLLDNSGPYESYSGTPLLVDSNKTYSGAPLLVDSQKTYSGTPLLLDSNGPYKSLSGTPLLLDTKGPYKSYSGTPLVINNPTPLSSWLGLPVLSK